MGKVNFGDILDIARPGLKILEDYDAGKRGMRNHGSGGEPLDGGELSFPSARDIVELHDAIDKKGLRSPDLLESAVNRPRQVAAYKGSCPQELAAVLAEAILRNHPFVDGNKRTALLSVLLFCRKNGLRVLRDTKMLARMTIMLTEQRMDVFTFAMMLPSCVVGKSNDEEEA